MTCAPGTMCQHQPNCTDYDCPGHPDRYTHHYTRGLPVFEPTTEELWDRFVHRAATVGLVILSLVVIVGIYLWVTH